MVIINHSADAILEKINSIHCSSVVVLVDENTANHCLPILPSFKYLLITVPAGEQSKSLTYYTQVIEKMLEANIDRNSLLINLGGGMICDLGGYVASTYKRGIRFIHLPTTLLSMVDAAHGGKNGINHHGIKNIIGTFNSPLQTIIYPPFLKTLAQDEIESGWVEMLKHGLLTSPSLYQKSKELLVTKDFNEETIMPFIETKLDIVRNDFNEKGERKKLNLGHTFGHAFESYFTSLKLQHGYAVLLGLWCELKLTGDQPDICNDITSFIYQFLNPSNYLINDIPAFFNYMTYDKKNAGSDVSMVGWKNFQAIEVSYPITAEQVEEVLGLYNKTFG